MSNFTVRL